MSKREKSLGQIAFEASQSGAIHPIEWDDAFCHETWERAAQAVATEVVKRELYGVSRSIIKAEGSAEERERLAKIHEDNAKKIAETFGPILNSGFQYPACFDQMAAEYRCKPWLEKWHAFDDPNSGHVARDSRDGGEWVCYMSEESNPDAPTLVAAAPEMCRALLMVEWDGSYYDGPGDHELSCCILCGSPRWRPVGFTGEWHHPTCTLDAALIKAGLPDQESRDSARIEMEKMK